MEDDLLQKLMPKLYDQHEFQQLLTATLEQQDAWIMKLREGFGLTTDATIEKQEQSTLDIEKTFQNYITKSQPQSGNSDIERRFSEMISKKGAF